MNNYNILPGLSLSKRRMMKKPILSLVTLFSLFALFDDIKAGAQVPFEQIKSFQNRCHLLFESETADTLGVHSNIDKFFTEWEEWSERINKRAIPSGYNSIFQKHFLENGPANDGAKYLVLPLNVKVIKYKGCINPDSLPDSLSGRFGTLYPEDLSKCRMIDSISIFTPVVENGKKVLYLSPEIQGNLTAFIGESILLTHDKSRFPLFDRKKGITNEDWEEEYKRRELIRKYVPTSLAYYGYYFTTSPLIREIIVGDDGYYIELDYSVFGKCYYVPWDSDPILYAEWIV